MPKPNEDEMYQGKRVGDMSREELINALVTTCRALNDYLGNVADIPKREQGPRLAMVDKLYCCANQRHDWEIICGTRDAVRIGCRNCDEQRVSTYDALPADLSVKAGAALDELMKGLSK